MTSGYERIHGGNTYPLERSVTDLSVNLSPLPVPEEVIAAAGESLEDIGSYPDPDNTLLKEAIGKKDGVAKEAVVCGNGAAGIIFDLFRALRPGKALLISPSFTEYERAADSVNAEKEYYCLREEDGFDLKEDVSEHIKSDTDALILCNPNNPTGKLIRPEVMEKIILRCRETGTFLAVDECFMEFSERNNSLIKEAENSTDIFIIKSFTKMFSCPGLRLGYGITGSGGLIREMELSREPWCISSSAEKAGIAACALSGHEEKVREIIKEEKDRMYRGLETLAKKGISFIHTDTNFILFRAPDIKGESLYNILKDKGILIRECSDFRGLKKGWYRTAIGSREANEKLFRALDEVL